MKKDEYTNISVKIQILQQCHHAACIAASKLQFAVPCKRRSSVNSGAWLRRFDDVTGVAKTDILR